MHAIVTQPVAALHNLTKRQEQIVALLQAKPLTRQEVMAGMDVAVSDRIMQLELMALKNMGIIQSQGKANKTVWFVI